MKKTIITAAAVLCTALGSFAQLATQQAAPVAGQPAQQMQHNMTSAEERAKRMTDQLNTAVQLSPEQYKKVMDVHKDFMTKMDAFRTANQSPTAGQAPPAAGAAANNRGEQFKKMNDEKDTQLKAILTPEQWQKWQDSRKMMPHPAPGTMQPSKTAVPATGQPQQH